MLPLDAARRSLTPADIASRLGLTVRREGRVLLTRCPQCQHPRRLRIYDTPTGPWCYCYPCGLSLSPYRLAMATHGLDTLAEALALLAPGTPHDTGPLEPAPEPPALYPPLHELPTIPVTQAARDYLATRGLVPPPRARCVHPRAPLPEWAQFARRYPLLIPAYLPDQRAPASVRFWTLNPRPGAPKRLAPASPYTTRGLTLRSHPDPGTIAPVMVAVEGEPDYCRAVAECDVPVIGWLSSSRLPRALTRHAIRREPVTLIVLTHGDAAGDRYAEAIATEAGAHVTVVRRRPARDLDELSMVEVRELLSPPSGRPFHSPPQIPP